MSRASLALLLLALFACLMALIGIDKHDLLVTIVCLIAAVALIIVGLGMMTKRCARCGREESKHCTLAPHVYDGSPNYVHDHKFTTSATDKIEPPPVIDQKTDEITPVKRTLAGIRKELR